MKAVCLIRTEPHYRREAFLDGLRRAGYRLHDSIADLVPTVADVLVIWNRYGPIAEQANRWEQQSGTVLVCENGYFGRDGQGRQYYAMAIHGHNGSGQWPHGDGARLARLGVAFKPWREGGAHVLVCTQRGLGPSQTAQPTDWPTRISRELRRLTPRPIKVRMHPGYVATDIPLADELRNAWAMVTWASNAATESLIAGVPVLYCGPHIVTAGAATLGIESITQPPLPDRTSAFERMAWAQWSVQEIESGEPFVRLHDLALQQPSRVQRVCGGLAGAHRAAGPVATR